MADISKEMVKHFFDSIGTVYLFLLSTNQAGRSQGARGLEPSQSEAQPSPQMK